MNLNRPPWAKDEKLFAFFWGYANLASKLTNSQHKDGNAIYYMIYKVLKIKTNQVLRENMNIPGVERNSSLGSISEESTFGCYF